MRVVNKIASEVEQSISHVGWGGGTITVKIFGVGLLCVQHASQFVRYSRHIPRPVSGEVGSVQKPNSGFAHVS